jgi:hypothetical protein
MTSLPAALLAILVVRRVNANQEERHRLVEEARAREPVSAGEPEFLASLGQAGPAAGSDSEFSFLPPQGGDGRQSQRPDDMPTPWLDEQ